MNEDYVSYELAVKLKAAGFDEPCDHYYDYDEKSKIKHLLISASPSEWDWNYSALPEFVHPECSAPHIYHAQKWLREKKGIYAYCEPNCLKKWFARAIDLAKNEDLLFDGEMFDSFEKATEYAISAALELIEQEKE